MNEERWLLILAWALVAGISLEPSSRYYCRLNIHAGPVRVSVGLGRAQW